MYSVEKPNWDTVWPLWKTSQQPLLKTVIFLAGLKTPIKAPIKALKWFKDGQLLTDEGRPKVQLFESMLRVNNVQTEDGGVYQCFITLDSGLEIQSSGELRLGGEVYFSYICT